MKIVKNLLLVLTGFVGCLLVAALLMRKNFTVERDITINKPRTQVFHFLKYLKNQDRFSKWANIDPGMKKEYIGVDGTVGFVSKWESKNKDVGVGEQEIKKIVDGERIDYELRFKVPFEGTDPAYIMTENAGENQTRVKWGYVGKMPYPMNLCIPMLTGMMEKDLDTGLTNLKTILEK